VTAQQAQEAQPPEDDEDRSPAVVGRRPVEVATLSLVLAFALLMMWDNWHTGARWESTGPQAGYFPFYVSLILAGACLWGLVTEAMARGVPSDPFVRRNQFGRVLQVFVPTLLYVPAVQWLGIYLSSFILVAGFMRFVGRIRWWACLVTAFVFAASMFAVFDVAFDVIMPKGPLERLFGR
jgi:putative tricarboxylic transport membrane protein